ncbi:MAG: response regulator [Clostridiales bacterium]|nr:response regulator [Clostridiales bacterium]
MLKIVIVEDEDIIRKGLAYMIDWVAMGYVVAGEAANGEEGLQMILELQPDVVLADIRMPKMDGITMLQEAGKQVQFKSLILTSYTEFEYARQAILLQVSDYILKPVDEEKLKARMLELHDEIMKKRENELVSENRESSLDMEYYAQLAQTENQYVAAAIRSIRESYAEKISIENIAEKQGISASYLSRKFKEITGHTFLDFLNKYRVQKAVQLLNEGQYKVYEISDRTGFSDYKHFCSVFKKYALMSPTSFVKQVSEVKNGKI